MNSLICIHYIITFKSQQGAEASLITAGQRASLITAGQRASLITAGQRASLITAGQRASLVTQLGQRASLHAKGRELHPELPRGDYRAEN